MQLNMKTRLSQDNRYGKYLLKLILPLVLAFAAIYLVSKMDMPSPNKLIKEEIPNDKLITVK